MFLIDNIIIYFIKYELYKFELNWMNVYIWYDIVSMFVNNVVCDRDIVLGIRIRVLKYELIGTNEYYMTDANLWVYLNEEKKSSLFVCEMNYEKDWIVVV